MQKVDVQNIFLFLPESNNYLGVSQKGYEIFLTNKRGGTKSSAGPYGPKAVIWRTRTNGKGSLALISRLRLRFERGPSTLPHGRR